MGNTSCHSSILNVFQKVTSEKRWEIGLEINVLGELWKVESIRRSPGNLISEEKVVLYDDQITYYRDVNVVNMKKVIKNGGLDSIRGTDNDQPNKSENTPQSDTISTDDYDNTFDSKYEVSFLRGIIPVNEKTLRGRTSVTEYPCDDKVDFTANTGDTLEDVNTHRKRTVKCLHVD